MNWRTCSSNRPVWLLNSPCCSPRRMGICERKYCTTPPRPCCPRPVLGRQLRCWMKISGRTGRRWSLLMPQSPVWTLTTAEWLDYIWCDMPQRDTCRLHTHLRKVLLHLLKWRYQPWLRFEGHSWLDTIIEQRRQFALLLGRRPSLRRLVPDVVAWADPG